MSVSVVIRTTKTLTPHEVFDHLMKRGEQIVITSDEFPSAKLGTHLKALRGIEINEDPEGYEVRVCSYASVADLQLFAVTIEALVDLSGGRAYLEDDDDGEISNVGEAFDEAWIENQREFSCNVVRALIKHSGNPIVMYGMFFKFCIGAEMYRIFDMPLNGSYSKKQMDKLQDYLCSIQWDFAEKEDTSTQLVIASQSSDKEGQTISGILIQDGEVKPFDYISAADFLAIMDLDDETCPPVLIPFEHAWKILPQDLFRPIDEWQYERIGDLSVEEVHHMMDQARHLQPHDLHYCPTYPGEGWDEEQNTVILTWDPDNSDVSIMEHNAQIPEMLTNYFCWDVHEYKRAKWGDRFYLVKRGAGETGVVMSGVFTSQPYALEYEPGCVRYYMDMRPNLMVNPLAAPILTIESLSGAIPSFDWSSSLSGCILSSEDAKKMEDLWEDYLDDIRGHIDGEVINAIDVNC